MFTPVANGPTYTFQSPVWRLVSGGINPGFWVGDAPPSTPVQGTLWWESDSGNSFIWYDDGSSAQWVQFNIAPPVALTVPVMTVVTSSGTYTKPSNLLYLEVEVQAGGGASGGVPATAAGQAAAAAGGGGGGYSRSLFPASALPATVPMTVGAGGAAVSAGAGGTGGASSFGSLIACNGGGGGTMTGATSGAAFVGGSVGGSVPTPGQLVIAGQAGGFGIALFTASWNVGGAGGSSHLGLGAQQIIAGTGGGTNNGAWGGGGAGRFQGASQPAGAGGVGGPGVIILREYFA
jgi:hypothetical protein